MQITYVGPLPAVVIAATGQTVKHGDSVDVPDALGVSLLEQDVWTATAPDKPARKGKTDPALDADTPED